MFNKKSILSIFIVVILMGSFISPMTSYADDSNGKVEGESYDDYRDIPGVNEQDIEAIENLKKDFDKFTYGAYNKAETITNKDGTVSGFTGLFCDYMSQMFDIEFEPEIYEPDQLTKGLRDKTIDFTGEFSQSNKSKDHYFMTDTIAERNIKIYRLAGAEDINEIEGQRPLRYAFLKDSNSREHVSKISSEVFTVTYVDNHKQAADLLLHKEIDAFLDTGSAEEAFSQYEKITSANYYPLVYLPVSLATENKELLPIIEVTNKYLEIGGLQYLVSLYNEGDIEYKRHQLEGKLTTMEKSYLSREIKKDEPIPIAMEYDNYPISFYNEHEKEFQGISNDIINEIQLLTGLKFEVINKADTQWNTLENQLLEGNALMISELTQTDERLGKFLWSKEPYSVEQFALLSKAESDFIDMNQVAYSKVGLIKDSVYEKFFYSCFPDHSKVQIVEDSISGFDALEKDEIDLLMGSTNMLLSITNYLERPEYKANLTFESNNESYFGFNSRERLLRSVVSKSQQLIDTDSINQQWKSKVFDYEGKVAGTRMVLLIIISMLLFVVVILIIIFLLKTRSMNRNLEGQVYERTKELEIASQAKSDFLSRMSHEIRTPLNAITGMAQIAKRDAADSPKVIGSVNQIINASSHLLGVLNDVLDMSKIESGKFQLTEETFLIKKALEEVVDMMELRSREENVEFVHDLDSVPDVAVNGDKVRIKQVLINLLGNGMKFTDKGGQISLSAKVGNETDQYLEMLFTVKDNGIGMNEEQMKNLFIPFEQADNTISPKYGGTGLGLAISQNFVKLMGSQIKAESQPGIGSEFSFSLNLKKENSENINKSEISTDHNEIDYTGKRALIAEDVEINRLIICEIFSSLGLQIDEAVNGKVAVDMFNNSKPNYYDIILMDIQMPEMDGIEATKTIRSLQRPEAKTIPIIAMTAFVYKEDIEKVLNAGMNDHIAKPVDMDKLKSAMNKYLF